MITNDEENPTQEQESTSLRGVQATNISDCCRRAILAECERMREGLDERIHELRHELGIPDASRRSSLAETQPRSQSLPGSIRVEDFIQPGEFLGKTQVDSVKEFLYRVRRPASFADIGAALYHGKTVPSPLSGSDLKALRDTLSHCSDFIPVTHDRWALAAWQPGLSPTVLNQMKNCETDTSKPKDQRGKPAEKRKEKIEA